MSISAILPRWLLLLLLLSTFLVEQNLAFLPTKRKSTRLVPKLAPSDAPRRWQQLPIITTVFSSSSSIDYAATEAPIQEYDDDSYDEEEDHTETYRINIELSRLASHCARHNGGRTSHMPPVSSSLLPTAASKSKKYHHYHPAMLAVHLLKSMTHQDTVAYNTVLKALAKSAPAMLMDIPDDDDTNHNNSLQESKSPQRISASQRAQTLLLEMIEHHKTQTAANQDWYERRASDDLTETEIAQGPPRVRIKPNVRSFSTVMDAWSRCGNVRATLQVMKALEDRYQASGYDVALQPNIFSYNTVLSAYAKSCSHTKQAPLYGSQSNNEKDGRQAAQECQAFLERMLSTSKNRDDNNNNNSVVRPDVISYNSCLHAWARSGVANAGEHAEALLRSMPMPPNTRSYTTCMDAWGRSRITSTATTTSNNNNNNNGEDANNSKKINTIKSPAARAHALLDELKDMYESTGNVQVKPNCISYSTVINAYANANKEEPLKAQKAYELLQEMRARGASDPSVLPNTVTYNSVLNACATSSLVASYSTTSQPQQGKKSNGEEEKLTCCLQEMITTLYNQLLLEQKITLAADHATSSQKDNATSSNNNNDNNNSFRKVTPPRLAPDHFTFGTVLKACANNIFWDDPQFGIRVFQEACRQGQVTLGVLIQLRQAVPTHTFHELLPAHAYHPKTKQFSMTNIPTAWKRNVRGRDQEAGSGSFSASNNRKASKRHSRTMPATSPSTITADRGDTEQQQQQQQQKQKRLICIRHARSEGNEMMAKPGNEWGNPTFCDDATLIDAKITDTGRKQVQEELLPKFMKDNNNNDDDDDTKGNINYHQLLKEVDLVVVSPLTRTQETFHYGVLPALKKIYPNGGKDSMPPILALPLSTERVYTASDTGRDVTELSQQFPHVDWSLMQERATEEKDWWYSHTHLDNETVAKYEEWRPHKEGQWYAVPGEPESHFMTRMKKLEEWIAAREEQTIMLVAHWGVIRYMTGGYSAENCEVTVLDQWKPLHQSNL